MVEIPYNRQFERSQLLLGREGISRLLTSTVAVFGIGGVGSFAVEALARVGVGRLVLVDHDVVDITNLNRQLHALHTTVGEKKVQLMAERVRLINPWVQVEAIDAMFTEDRMDMLQPGWDYVIDAIDMVSAKLALIRGCVAKGIPIVSSMGAGNKLDPTRFVVEDISRTHTCPLAKVVRRELRRVGITSGVKVVFSTEPPLFPDYEAISFRDGETNTESDLDLTPRRKVPGSVPYVPSVAGMILASVVINQLSGAAQARGMLY